jgi:hypothetical protein
MMLGYLEGRLVSKSGDFVAAVGCGVIEFRCRNKALAGRLRGMLTDLSLAATTVVRTRDRRTRG